VTARVIALKHNIAVRVIALKHNIAVDKEPTNVSQTESATAQ
jgi:hypothetical protein